MNKTAIKNFAIWARNKLIADITYKAGLLGISEKGIKSPLPQSTQTVQFFDIGTKEPSSVTGIEIQQRKKLIEEIERKAKQSDYATAYKNVIEEVAYTWFNRLIAIRFMEVNDYLPTRIRVLSSESNGKAEPDLVTHALEANLDYSAYEKDRIIQLKHENKLDELFRMLFIKQCNSLNSNLPELFERTSDYTELLLNVSFTDKEGVVYHLVNDISEDDFNVSKEGQVEIIGWLYQYYNTEPKDETFAQLKKNVKITKERIPAATQLFTPDWIVRYMVENSLGRLWLEGHPNDELKENWEYYLDETEQEDDVQKHLDKIREEYKTIKPEDIKVIDPAMGSGHILVYAFDVLMQIYESHGYSQRDAAKSIVENNLFGLDIDTRAYQLAYFAVMMKARQYNRRILNGETNCHVYAIQESNDINRNQLKYFGAGLSEMEKNTASLQLQGLLDTFTDAKEYGSILKVENYNWELLHKFIDSIDANGQMSLDSIGVEFTRNHIRLIVEIGKIISNKYDVVITNPPYMKADNMSKKLSDYVYNYKNIAKYDLYSAFIYRCHEFMIANGYLAMITMHNFMFAPSFLEMRDDIKYWSWVNMLHLGSRAFSEISGEVVQTVAFIITKRNIKTSMQVVDVTSIKAPEEKEKAFLRNKENAYLFDLKEIDVIPGHAFGYALGSKVIRLYEQNLLLGQYGVSKAGVVTGEDDVFVRYWFEVNNEEITYTPEYRKLYKYVLFSKGGTFNKWYGNAQNVLKLSDMWDNNKTNKSVRRGDLEYYYKKGIGWSQIAGGVNKAYSEMVNAVCKTTTPMFYVFDSEKYNYILGYLNSSLPPIILKSLNPTLSILTSDIVNLPFLYDESYKKEIDQLVKSCLFLSKSMYAEQEENWQFKKNPLIEFNRKLSDLYSEWKRLSEKRCAELIENEKKLNHIFIDIMGLREELSASNNTPIVINDEEAVRRFISYLVGCLFGRYSLDDDGLAYAGGVWDEKKFNHFLPDRDNILPITDEEYFSDDIVFLIVDFIKKVYGAQYLEENLNFIANALSNRENSSRETIRNYFVKEFFKDHCKFYQKRPIYWLFDSGKHNGFKALIYMHRYDENTIGNLRIDYLHRMQRIYENEIARMQDTIENSRDAREVTFATKRKEKLIKQLQETKEYDEKIAHLALARTSIDLDDGVKVNYEKVQTDRDGKKLDVLAKI